jgi:hypothetical protein
MQLLDDFDRDLYEQTYNARRWIYATRADGELFALGLVVVGEQEMIPVPTCCCWSESFKEMRSYVDFLNQERLARVSSGKPKPEKADIDIETSSRVA